MKTRIMKLLIAAAAGATVFQGGCGFGSGQWLKFLGDFVGDAIWLRVVD
jgi:PII-like signaling protein